MAGQRKSQTESICRGCDLVDQIWVYGNSYESTLVAIVVPDKKQLMGWAKENGMGSDFKAVCQKPEVSPLPDHTKTISTWHCPYELRGI